MSATAKTHTVAYTLQWEDERERGTPFALAVNDSIVDAVRTGSTMREAYDATRDGGAALRLVAMSVADANGMALRKRLCELLGPLASRSRFEDIARAVTHEDAVDLTVAAWASATSTKTQEVERATEELRSLAQALRESEEHRERAERQSEAEIGAARAQVLDLQARNAAACAEVEAARNAQLEAAATHTGSHSRAQEALEAQLRAEEHKVAELQRRASAAETLAHDTQQRLRALQQNVVRGEVRFVDPDPVVPPPTSGEPSLLDTLLPPIAVPVVPMPRRDMTATAPATAATVPKIGKWYPHQATQRRETSIEAAFHRSARAAAVGNTTVSKCNCGWHP